MIRFPTTIRQYIMVLVSIAVVSYSLAVIWRVADTCNLRIFCLFSQKAHGPGPGLQIDQVVFNKDSDGREPYKGNRRPRRGDWLVSVGGVPIDSFQQFVTTIGKLKDADPWVMAAGADVTEDPDANQLRTRYPNRFPLEVAALPLPDGSLDRWVPIEIRAESSSANAPLEKVWVRLQPIPANEILLSVGWFLLKMIIFVIGAVVFWRRPTDQSAVLFFVLCAVTVVAFVGGFHWSHLVGSRVLMYAFIFCAMLVAPVNLHFYLCFPRPFAIVRRHPWLTLAAIYSLPAIFIGLLLGTLIYMHWHPDDAALGERSLQTVGDLALVYVVISALLFFVGLAVLILRFTFAPAQAERNQVKWILLAALASSVPIVIVLFVAATDPASLAFGVAPKPLMLVASILFTGAYAVSITRYKLMQAGRLINRWLLYFVISFAAMGLFCLLVAAWNLLGVTEGLLWTNVLIVGLTVLLVLVMMGWLGDYYQRSTEQRFMREKYQLDKAIRRLGSAVDQLVEPNELLGQMLQAVMTAVSAERGAVYFTKDADGPFICIARLGGGDWPKQLPRDCALAESLLESSMSLVHVPGDGFARATASYLSAEEYGAPLAFGLEANGKVAGFVLLGPKEDEQVYTEEDRNFLTALSRTTALALQSSQGYRTIERLRKELEAKLAEIAEQRQRILFLQGELGGRQGPKPNRESAPSMIGDPIPLDTLRHNIRGSSRAVRELLGHVAKVARSPSSVLVRGESGTGKELLAQAIHANGMQSQGPFVAVHCAALSPSLLESELFGHVKGAFTGADRDKAGRFELADCGTLFLDEIGDVTMEVQTKLLRVLQEQAFERVGGTETIRVDVRLIAATHRDLETLIREGRFREDLYYRLNVISLWSPPLRDRDDDVLELALYFLRAQSERIGKPVRDFAPDVLAVLKAYAWPGNVRQLENAIERAVVLAEGDSIRLHDLPPEIVAAVTQPGASRGGDRPHRVPRTERAAKLIVSAETRALPARRGRRLDDSLSEMERQEIISALSECDGNKALAAKRLGIPRSTLFSKLRKYGLG